MAYNDSLLITVAICTRNRAAFLERAIRSVLPQLSSDTELLVVDNASTDDTRQVCERLARETGVVVYLSEPKLGLSAARNTAINKASGIYVLFLDDDATAETGWLNSYRDFLINPPSSKIAVVGGAVIPFYDRHPPKWITPGHNRFDLGNQPLRLTGSGLMGGNSVYDRAAVMAVGLFDERLGYKGNQNTPREETELQDRLIKTGWECWWLPGAAIQHFVPAERLTIKAMTHSNFNAGRAAAIHRLKSTHSVGQRLGLRFGRLFISPFHIIINLMLALLMFVFWKKKQAVAALCRCTRAAGWARQVISNTA